MTYDPNYDYENVAHDMEVDEGWDNEEQGDEAGIQNDDDSSWKV